MEKKRVKCIALTPDLYCIVDRCKTFLTIIFYSNLQRNTVIHFHHEATLSKNNTTSNCNDGITELSICSFKQPTCV